MKKLMLLAVLYCLQPDLHAASSGSNVKHDVVVMSASDRARAHFRENYAWVEDATWFTTADKNMYCLFHQGNIVNRVFYNAKGAWQYTLLSYPASDLPRAVKRLLLDNFSGYQISYVNEIRSDDQEPVYMVNIENQDNIKVIQIIGDEFAVTKELLKR